MNRTIDLTTTVAGIHFKTPIVAASTECGADTLIAFLRAFPSTRSTGSSEDSSSSTSGANCVKSNPSCLSNSILRGGDEANNILSPRANHSTPAREKSPYSVFLGINIPILPSFNKLLLPYFFISFRSQLRALSWERHRYP